MDTLAKSFEICLLFYKHYKQLLINIQLFVFNKQNHPSEDENYWSRSLDTQFDPPNHNIIDKVAKNLGTSIISSPMSPPSQIFMILFQLSGVFLHICQSIHLSICLIYCFSVCLSIYTYLIIHQLPLAVHPHIPGHLYSRLRGDHLNNQAHQWCSTNKKIKK